MGRIEKRFSELRKRDEKALVAFVTAGDPDMETTRDVVGALDRAGVDILELGVPFSDATADGPIIQDASRRALKRGASLQGILGFISEMRKTSETPVVLFGYYNPIFSYGPARFAREAASAGVDAVLVVDLPWEERRELRRFTDPAGIETVTLIAPTTGEERARKMVRNAAGFLYYISVTGVTGTVAPAVHDTKRDLARLKGLSSLPVVAGFGITAPAQAADLARHADGIVVGSALVKLIHEHRERGDVATVVTAFASDLKKAMNGRERTTASLGRPLR